MHPSYVNSVFLDCLQPSLVGDAYCHDETNNLQCAFDGGDCCGPCINRQFCTECQCLSESGIIEIINPSVGNGYCNDEYNIENCNYDGGDCCLSCMDNLYCLECVCHEEGVIASNMACK